MADQRKKATLGTKLCDYRWKREWQRNPRNVFKLLEDLLSFSWPCKAGSAEFQKLLDKTRKVLLSKQGMYTMPKRCSDKNYNFDAEQQDLIFWALTSERGCSGVEKTLRNFSLSTKEKTSLCMLRLTDMRQRTKRANTSHYFTGPFHKKLKQSGAWCTNIAVNIAKTAKTTCITRMLQLCQSSNGRTTLTGRWSLDCIHGMGHAIHNCFRLTYPSFRNKCVRETLWTFVSNFGNFVFEPKFWMYAKERKKRNSSELVERRSSGTSTKICIQRALRIISRHDIHSSRQAKR